MLFSNSVITIAGLAGMASAHGIVVSPTPRGVGAAYNTTCGTAIAAIVTGDNTSHVEGLPEAGAKDSAFNSKKCNLFLCKGLQYADNMKNVMTYKPGQVVQIKVSITVPHEGPANMSVVDTATNMILGSPLISFKSYADEAQKPLPKNNTDFTVTMPNTLGKKCAVGGACVLQWFWFGTKAAQTYESCVDFTMAAPASSGSPSSSTSPGSPGNPGSSSTSSTTGTSGTPGGMSPGMPGMSNTPGTTPPPPGPPPPGPPPNAGTTSPSGTSGTPKASGSSGMTDMPGAAMPGAAMPGAATPGMSSSSSSTPASAPASGTPSTPGTSSGKGVTSKAGTDTSSTSSGTGSKPNAGTSMRRSGAARRAQGAIVPKPLVE